MSHFAEKQMGKTIKIQMCKAASDMMPRCLDDLQGEKKKFFSQA